MITNCWSLVIHAQGEDSKKGQLIYIMQKGSFQVILYKMIRFLSGKLKKHTKLAKIVKINEIFNRLVLPPNPNRFCHPMTFIFSRKDETYLRTKKKIIQNFVKCSKFDLFRDLMLTSCGLPHFLYSLSALRIAILANSRCTCSHFFKDYSK